MGSSAPSFEDSQYDRPNQAWDCGHACEGLRCLLGPSKRGSCQADFECAPLNKNNKWLCDRRNGSCEAGPDGAACSRPIAACSPVASIRHRRGAFILWCCTLALGLMLLTLGASWRDQVIKPGELSNQHGQIIRDRAATNRCAACHPASDNASLGEWTQLSITGHHEAQSQSERCLDCHQEKIGTISTALLPHGLPSDLLAQKTRSLCERLQIEPRSIDLAGMQNGQVACAACHREHQGMQHDLTAVSSSQCAECHQQNFRSLAEHPDFGAWPYQRRTRIAFDHATHSGRYFPEQKQAFACNTCHIQNGQEIVGVVSYESCRSCHDGKIQQSFGDGVPLLALPMLDLRSLKAEGLSVGEWPEMANGDFDGALPSLTRILLSSDDIVRASLEQFGNDFEFADVDPGNLDDVEAAADIAWGMKRLIFDLSAGDSTAMQKRLESALGTPLTAEQLRDLLGQISRESAVKLQQTWFPNLAAEVAMRKAGKPLPVVEKGIAVKVSRSARGVNQTGASGWHRDDETFTFQYRPSGHESMFMKRWLDVVCKAETLRGSEAVQAAFKQMTSQTSAGLCATCHSVDQMSFATSRPNAMQRMGSYCINWKANGAAGSDNEQDRDREQEPICEPPDAFTRFAHEPHLILPQLRDCESCHAINTEVSTAADYAQHNPLAYQAGFHPITKAACASCHAPKLAGDRCTLCHQYHVGAKFDLQNLTKAMRIATASPESNPEAPASEFLNDGP